MPQGGREDGSGCDELVSPTATEAAASEEDRRLVPAGFHQAVREAAARHPGGRDRPPRSSSSRSSAAGPRPPRGGCRATRPSAGRPTGRSPSVTTSRSSPVVRARCPRAATMMASSPRFSTPPERRPAAVPLGGGRRGAGGTRSPSSGRRAAPRGSPRGVRGRDGRRRRRRRSAPQPAGRVEGAGHPVGSEALIRHREVEGVGEREVAAGDHGHEADELSGAGDAVHEGPVVDVLEDRVLGHPPSRRSRTTSTTAMVSM